ncbi:MAG: hypothetical protein RMJ35_05965, partial [Phycisphaerales bacterium]|nr:hypothetical protein [Phycisphaerales bacterium]
MRWRHVSTGAVLSSVLAFGASAAADSYRFVRIADTRTSDFSFDPNRQPAINNLGSVLFYANSPGFIAGYHHGSGLFTAPIITTTHPALSGLTLQAPSYNDSGQVAFYAERPTPDGFRVYRVDAGGTVTLIAQSGSGTFGGFRAHVSMNSSGRVAFTATGGSGLNGLYVGSGTSNLRLYGNPGDGVTSLSSGPSLNDDGTVSFAGNYLPVSGGAHLSGAGGPINVIGSTSANGISLFGESVIDNSGRVLFGAFRFSAPTHGLFRGSGGSVLSTVADTDGDYASLPIVTGIGAGGFPSMNNSGSLAFAATLDSGGRGIFTGSNPATSAVIRDGSTLFGRTVDHFFGGLSREAINDSGEIAFQARLIDGAGFSNVVAKAVPVPDQRWSSTTGGLWSDGSNWLGPVPNALYHTANFTDAITSDSTITVDGSFRVGTINFHNTHRYLLDGTGEITLYDSFGGMINVSAGSHHIKPPVSLQGTGTVNTAGGSSILLDKCLANRAFNAT